MNDETKRADEGDLRAYFEPGTAKAAGAAEPVPVTPTPFDPPLTPATSGFIPFEARQAMQKLLAKGHLLDRTASDEYASVVTYQNEIRKVLADLGIALRIVPEYKMVAIESLADAEDQVNGDDIDTGDDDDDEGGNALVRVTRLRLLHSLVLIALRGYYREREFEDPRVVIDLDVLKERVRPFWPLLDAESRSERKMSGAIKVLERHGVLLKVRGAKDRREISPVIVLVMGSSEFALLNAEYARLAQAIEKGGTNE